jgi:hypothetical protein
VDDIATRALCTQGARQKFIIQFGKFARVKSQRRVQGAFESGAWRYILRANLITFLLITFAILIAARYDIAPAISYELIIGREGGERVGLVGG